MARYSVEAVFRAIDKMTGPVGKMESRIERFSRRTKRAMRNAADSAVQMAGRMRGIATSAALVGAAAIAGSVKFGEAGMNYEQAITAVGAVMMKTREEISDLDAKAREIGRTTKFTAIEAANGMELMARAGFKNEDILSGIGGVMDAAAASGLELAEVTGFVSDALKGMGLSTSQTTHVADVLTLASSKTNSTIGSLGESLKNVASTARQLNIPFTDTVAGIALLQDVGLDASVAGSAMNTMLTQIAKPTKELKIQMRDMGVSFKDAEGNALPFMDILKNMSKGGKGAGGNMDRVAFFADLVGLRGQKAASNLAMLFDEVDKETGKNRVEALVDQLQKADAAAKKMAELRMDNLAGDVTKLSSAFDDLRISIYDTKSSGIRDIVKSMTDWITKNRKLITQGFDKFVTNVLPVVKDLAKTFGGEFKDTVLAAAKGLSMFFSSDDSKSKAWRATLTSLAKNLGQLAGVAVMATAVFSGLAAGMLVVSNAIYSSIVGAVKGAIDALGERIFFFADWFANISAVFSDNGMTLVERALALGKQIVFGLVKGIKSVASYPIDVIKNMGGGVIRALKDSMGIKSPSRPARYFGENVGGTLAKSLASKVTDVTRASSMLGSAALYGMRGNAQSSDFTFGSGSTPTIPTIGPERIFSSTVTERIGSQFDGEVTIRDETGRAVITKQPNRSSGARLRLAPSGGM